MKAIATVILLLATTVLRGDEIEEKFAKFNEDYEELRKEIRLLDDKDLQRKHWDALREVCSAFYPFGFLYSVNFSDDLQEKESEEILVEAVYRPYIC